MTNPRVTVLTGPVPEPAKRSRYWFKRVEDRNTGSLFIVLVDVDRAVVDFRGNLPTGNQRYYRTEGNAYVKGGGELDVPEDEGDTLAMRVMHAPLNSCEKWWALIRKITGIKYA